MRDPRAADILRDKAKAASQGDVTGVAMFGPLVVAFYPLCERFAWFLDGQPINKRDAMTWLVKPRD
jgi:hypothetical protein